MGNNLGKKDTSLYNSNGRSGTMSIFDKIVPNFISLINSKETKNFAEMSVENLAKICMAGDLGSAIQEGTEIIKYAGSIKDILFWEKMKKWLQGTYDSSEMGTKISAKFTEDSKKYQEYTKRQLQCIAEIDEEEKIDYYANLTRSWLNGWIDTSVYFKLSYLLKVFTLEELKYLKENYTEEELDKVNYYIREFSLYGLIDVIEETNLGHTRYKYSDLAEVFLHTGIAYDECPEKYENIKLEDLKVENTKTCMELVVF